MLSPVLKILETLILTAFKQNFPLAEHQHGFKECRSTTTALPEITSSITNRLNQQWTVVVTLDLSRTFDTIDHSIVINLTKRPKTLDLQLFWRQAGLRWVKGTEILSQEDKIGCSTGWSSGAYLIQPIPRITPGPTIKCLFGIIRQWL